MSLLEEWKCKGSLLVLGDTVKDREELWFRDSGAGQQFSFSLGNPFCVELFCLNDVQSSIVSQPQLGVTKAASSTKQALDESVS